MLGENTMVYAQEGEVVEAAVSDCGSSCSRS